jgi:hypothetical protein
MNKPPYATPPSLTAGERKVFQWATAILFAIILDGAARKWLLPPSLQAIPYFAKDILAAIFVLTYPINDRYAWAPRLGRYILAIAVLLAPAFVMGLAEVPLGAIVVYKNAVLWPLFAVCLGQRLTERVVQRLLKLLLICSIGMACLAILQYNSSRGSILNRYAWGEEATAEFLKGIAVAGEFVRATGTFSYISGLSAFSLASFSLFLGRSLSLARGRDLLFASVGVTSALICGFASGSRSVQVFMFAVGAVSLVLAPKRKRYTSRLVGGLISAAVVVLMIWNTSMSKGVVDRWAGTDEDNFRGRVTGSSTGQPVSEVLRGNPFGRGLGIYSGFATLNGAQDRLNLAYNEGSNSRVAVETGILGFGAIMLGFGFILRAASWMSKIRNPALKTRLIPVFAGALIALVLGVWYDHNSTALWWWTIGIWLGEGLAIPKFGLNREFVWARQMPRRLPVSARQTS